MAQGSPRDGPAAPAPVRDAPAAAGTPPVSPETPTTELRPRPVTPDTPTVDQPAPPAPGGPEPVDAPPLIDRYAVEEEIGRGGMGVVYRAFDRELGRRVALKVLLEPEGAPRELSARFLDEALATAQLQHPGIVPVYDVGRDRRGRLYFVMKLVRGHTLAEIVRRARGGASAPSEREDAGEPWTRFRLAQAFVEVARAVAYAHGQGVLHRDLKPQNIMIGRFGEVHVMDWGLAKVRAAASSREGEPAPAPVEDVALSPGRDDTRGGSIVGTPAYMAPEQAAGDAARLGPATDVYALGALLYHVLTGRAPFEGTSMQQVLREVRERAPEPPRRLDASVPRELEAVCLKALAKSPGDRYAGADALARDVQAWLEGGRVAAFPEGPVARAWKLALRYRRAAGATAISLALGLALSVAGLVAANGSRKHAEEEAARAETERVRAEAGEREARKNLAVAFRERAERAEADEDHLGAEALLAHVVTIEDDRENRERLIAARLRGGLRARWWRRYQGISPAGERPWFAISEDGRRFASAIDPDAAADGGGRRVEISVYDLEGNALPWTITVSADQSRGMLALSPRGDLLAAALRRYRTPGMPEDAPALEYAAVLWRVGDGPHPRLAIPAEWPRSVDFLDGGARLFVGSITVGEPPVAWDTEAIEPAPLWVPDQAKGRGTPLAPDGRRWVFSTGRAARVVAPGDDADVEVGPGALVPHCVSSDGRRIAMQSGGRLGVWDTTSGERLLDIDQPLDGLRTNAGTLEALVDDGRILAMFPALANDGRTVAFSNGRAATLTHVCSGATLARIRCEGKVWAAFPVAGGGIAVVDDGGVAKLYHGEPAAEGTVMRVWSDRLGGFANVFDFHPDGARLLVRGEVGKDVTVRRIDDRGEAVRLEGAPQSAASGSGPSGGRFSPDGRAISLSTAEGVSGSARLFDAGTGALLAAWPIPWRDAGLGAWPVSPDGRLICVPTASAEPTPGDGYVISSPLVLRRIDTGAIVRELPTLPRHSGVPAFAPDGRSLVSPDGRCVLDLGQERLAWRFSRPPSAAALALQAKREIYAYRAWGDLTAVWDGKSVLVLDGADAVAFTYALPAAGASIIERGVTVRFAFSPDGRRLAFSQPGRLTMVDLERGAILYQLPCLDERTTRLEWSPDGKKIAACEERTVVVIDVPAVERALAKAPAALEAESRERTGLRVWADGVRDER